MSIAVEQRSNANPEGIGPRIEATGLSKAYRIDGGTLTVFKELSIAVNGGAFVSIIGPSGCGKSSLLHVLSGLSPPTSGEVTIDGSVRSERQDMFGYMFQEDLLLPWKTVADNVGLGLRVSAGVKAREARERAMELLQLYGLDGFGSVFPSQLSGGMRQRAAFMRTLLMERGVLLLDEPFGALDALSRTTMQDWLLRVIGGDRKTVVLVTHDIEEAILLADRVFVMSARPGRIVAELEIALPRPRNRKVRLTEEFQEYRASVFDALSMESGDDQEYVH